MSLYFWQHFYELTNRVAFSIGSVHIYYYALCYIAALLLALALGKFYAKYLGISKQECDDFFIYLEVGIILGARLGYVFIYSTEPLYYALHPWQIFNPFDASGHFVGIAGMSYHGACVGAVIGSYIYAKRRHGNDFRKSSALLWLDLVALAAPFAYTLGRIGNFLNHELFGRVTTMPWGVYVDGAQRHPSQLYEAVLEGLLIGCLMSLYLKIRKNKALKSGEFILLYASLYSVARFVCEIFREPDVQLGKLALNLSMGQWLSMIMFIISIGFYIKILRSKNA